MLVRAARNTLALIAVASAGVAHARTGTTDNQLWTEVDLSAKVSKRIALTGLATLRAGDRIPNPTFAALGGGLVYRLSNHWSASAADYWIEIRTGASGARRDLQLPTAAITYSTKLGPLTLEDRNRVERVIGLPGLNWRYRNRLSLSHAAEWGPLRRIFVSDEVFYDGARARWSRNRTQVGLELAAVGSCNVQIYYLRQGDRFSRFRHLNVLGTALAIKI